MNSTRNRRVKHTVVGALIAAAGLGLAVAPASADVLLSDNFNSYTSGNLMGQGPWVQVPTEPASTLPYDDVQVSGGAVVLTPGDGTTTAGQWVEAALTPAVKRTSADQSIYYAADISVTSAAAGDYFMSVRNSGTSKSYAAQLWAKADPADATGTKYLLGLSIASGGLVWGTDDLTLGQTYHIVAQYLLTGSANGSTDYANLYVDPADAATQANDTPYAATSSNTGKSSGLANLDLREGTQPLAPLVPISPTVTLDNLVVSTDFTSAAVTPEPASLALIGLAGAFLLSGRRRG